MRRCCRRFLAQVQAPSASLLARTSPMEDARLGVRGTDSALESALGGETSLMSAGGRSNALRIAGFRHSSPHSSRQEGSRIHMDKKTTEMLLNQPTIASVMRNAG